MVSLTVILFSTKCFLFVYMYIDLLKLKAYKLFENSDADLSWLLFKEAHLSIYRFESLYTFAVRSHDFLASTRIIQQFQNFTRFKLNINCESKFDKYRVENGNKQSVSKTCTLPCFYCIL